MNRAEYEAQVGEPHEHDSHEVQQQQLVFLKVEHWSWATDPQAPVQRDWTTYWVTETDDALDHPVPVPLAWAIDWIASVMSDGCLDPEWRWSIETEHFSK